MTNATPPRRVAATLFTVALGLVAVVNLVPRVGYISGDALIHVIIAERLAAGHWFEFNPGEVSSGTTSVAWTVFEALLLRAGGHELLMRVVPAIDLAGLVAAALLVRSLARRLGAATPHATVAALVCASVPALTYNAVLGMENIVFAAFALAFLDRYAATAGAPRRATTLLGLGGLLAVAVLLRPEGVTLAAVPLVGLVAARGERRRDAWRDLAVVGLGTLVLVLPFALKHHAVTGHWAPGSGMSRVMTARRQATSFHLGPLWIYLGVVLRFVVYAPLSAFALLGALAPPADAVAREARRGLVITLGLGLVLYTFITGAGHVGRLMQWLLALACALAALGYGRASDRLAARPRTRDMLLGLCAALHLALIVGETALRLRDPTQLHGGGHDLAWIASKRDARTSATDEALQIVCGGGCCRPGVTPTLGFTEVQMRFVYDARMRVASFDGRTSSLRARAVRFDARGCPQIGALLDDPAMVAVPEPPYFQFPGCPMDPVGRHLTTAWDHPEQAPPPGWRWDARLPGWVRVCGP